MASAVTSTAISEALKVWYGRQQRLERVLHGQEDRVIFNKIQKVNFSGRSYPVPVYYGRAAGGRSRTFANAQANSSSMKVAEFDPGATLAQDHSVLTIDTETLGRASVDKGTFLREQIMRTDEVLSQLADNTEFALTGNGYNALSQLTTISGATFKCVDSSDAKKYEVGMELIFSVSETTGSMRDSGDTVTVTKVDAINNVITVDATLDGGSPAITGLTANDYVFVDGDEPQSSGVRSGIYGFGAWASTPVASESFLGVDRTTSTHRLSMLAFTGSRNDIGKAVIDGTAYAKDLNGGRQNVGYISPLDFARLNDQVNADVERAPGSETVVGYNFIPVNGAGGRVQMIPSPYVSEGDLWLLDWSTWYLLHLHQSPIRINDDDGSMARRQTSDSGIEIRADSFVQMYCSRPGHSLKVDISSD